MVPAGVGIYVTPKLHSGYRSVPPIVKEVCTPSHDKNESSFSVDQQREKNLEHVSSLSPAKVEVKVPMREVG
ncbi:hypothetical protein TNCV_3198661 [Trichonephila clavipes]|nr:hypothetical protein TNCV_3198661 [Trichonephila clavipes]